MIFWLRRFSHTMAATTTTVTVAEDLNFDVPAAGDEAFKVDAGTFEVSFAEALNGFESFGQRGGIFAQAHADAAAAAGALEHHRKTDAIGFDAGVAAIPEETRTGENGRLALDSNLASGVFQAEGADLSGGGPDKRDAVGFAGFGKVWVLT